MDVCFIDAKKKLQPEHIVEFSKDLQEDTIVTMHIEPDVIFEKPLKEMRKFFEDSEIKKWVVKDCVISFLTEDRLLQILECDFTYWRAVYRGKAFGRLTKLFGKNDVSEVKQKSRSLTVKLSSAIKVNDKLENIETFEGSVKDAVNYVNKKFALVQMKSLFEQEPVFLFEKEPEFADISEWQTLEEGIKGGRFLE